MCNLCGRAPAKLHQAESVLYWGISINTQVRPDCQERWVFYLRQTLTHSVLFQDLQSIFTPIISFSHPKGPQGRQVRGRHPAFLAGETEAETGAGMQSAHADLLPDTILPTRKATYTRQRL